MGQFKSTDLKPIVVFQLNRLVTNLYKDSLFILEELVKDNKITNAKYQFLRKRILDKGNDCNRELVALLDKFAIYLVDADNSNVGND